MRHSKLLFGLMMVLTVASCSDLGDRSNIVSPEAPDFSHLADCEFDNTRRTTRSYLVNPERRVVTRKLRAIEDAGCMSAAGGLLALEILGILEDVLEADRGGSPADGASLATDLLHCCLDQADDVQIGEEAFDTGGIFWVRSNHGSTDPVISRDPVEMVVSSELGGESSYPAVLVIAPESGDTWPTVLEDGVEVIYGGPDPSDTAPYSVYQVDEAAKLGFQSGKRVRVVFCFEDIPAPGESELPTVERDGTILPITDAGTLCDETGDVWLAMSPPSPIGQLVRWAGQLVLPQPLVARQSFRWFVGGANGFSDFGLNNADPNGTIQFVLQPPNVVPSTAVAFDVAARALSGGGTPIGDLTLVLGLTVNLGTPADIGGGPFLDCAGVAQSEPVSCTTQSLGIATWEDINVTKPGGYIFTADALSDDWNLETGESEQFHVRND